MKDFKITNYRIDDINKKLDEFGYDTLDVLVVGATGAGKSTTVNSLMSSDAATIGYGANPETMDIKAYLMDNNIQLWDTPGLGDSPEMDIIHSKKIIDELQARIGYGTAVRFIDMTIVVVEAGIRDMGTVYSLIQNVILPNMKDYKRIIIALNQADLAMKGANFDYTTNKPNDILKQFLEDKVNSTKQRLLQATGHEFKVVYYSAETGYNIKLFLDTLIDSIPNTRRCY